MTAPTPPMHPSTSMERMGPSGNVDPISSPSHSTPASIQSMGYCPKENVVWNMTNRIRKKIGKPTYLFDKFVELMKEVHSVEAEPGELPDMKQQTIGWLEKVRGLLPEEKFKKLQQIVNDVPDRHTILHADFHLRNIMIAKDGLMLIDMDTLCTGDPIFELSTVYVSYRQFPSIDPMAAAMLGIDVKTANHICDRTMELYLGESGTQRMEETIKKARILGCVRIIDYMDRHREHPATEMCINRCLHDLIDDI